MDLDLSDDQEFLRDTTRRFLEAETPVASLRAREGDADGFDRTWWRRGAELGWTSLLVPEEHGGGSLAGEGLLDLVVVAEEMGRVAAPGALLPVNLVAHALARWGTPEQQALLPSMVAGDTLASWALFEPGGTWDVAGVGLTATPAAGGWRLDGTKALVEAGNLADQLLVAARAPEGPTQFLVTVSAPGITVTNEESLDLGRRYATVGFDGTEVPATAVVGQVGGAERDIEELLRLAAVVQLAETCGAIGRVFEFTLEYLGDRYSFGRPLSSYQALKHRVADMKMWLEASFGVATAAARAVQRDGGDASALVSAAKVYVGEKGTDLVQDCVQLHGGIGVTWEHDLHLFLRRATVNRFTYGTPDEHRERLAVLAGI